MLEVNAGAQIEAVIGQAQSTLNNQLSTAVSDLSAQQQQLVFELTGVVNDIQNKIINNLTSKLQTITNSLPFANFSQLSTFGGNIVAPNVPGGTQLTVNGNFFDIGQHGYDATIQLASNIIPNTTKITSQLTLTIPRATFAFVADKVTYIPCIVTIPYRVSEVLGLIHKKELATFSIIL